MFTGNDKIVKKEGIAEKLRNRIIILFILVVFFPVGAFGSPTTAAQAERLVKNWLGLDESPLDTSLYSAINTVRTYYDDHSQPMYHIVYTEPKGFVIVAGDDLVEPIIGFVAQGEEYDPSLENPLGALVSQDVPARVKNARKLERQPKGNVSDSLAKKMEASQNKWEMLMSLDDAEYSKMKVSLVSDVRVAPLLQTFWGQTREGGGQNCYNLFTPNNYPSGCVATAISQILRYFEFPTTGVGTASYNVSVDGTTESRSLMGGDGSGGAYDWALMTYGPTINNSDSRAMIGRLMNDAGVSVNMQYSSGGSGAYMSKVADAFKNIFGYTNAIKGYASGSIASTDLNNMTNANLDAGYPVAFGITRTGGGHAVVGDGYGYQGYTLYHHINMGWNGSQNAWYNLPTVDDDYYGYDSVSFCIYNIYTSGTGEIISGRVIDSNGDPISGATVTAVRSGGGLYSDTTGANGIYALVKVNPASSYQISVSKDGYSFTSKSVSTLTSYDYNTVGNKWGVNFSEGAISTSSFPWSTFLQLIMGR